VCSGDKTLAHSKLTSSGRGGWHARV